VQATIRSLGSTTRFTWEPETVLALADENVEWIPMSALMEGNRYH
jgi:hypothetical protein